MADGKHGDPLDRPAAWRVLLIVAAAFGAAGCKTTLDVSNLRNVPQPSESAPQYAESQKTDDSPGPLQKILQVAGLREPESGPKDPRPLEGVADLAKAEELYKTGDYKEAEKEFKRIAKKYKDTQIEEDALFMLGESRFEQKRYSWAQDAYEELFERFPSTRYSDRAAQRLFTIAHTWLQFPDMVTADDVQQVDFEDPSQTPPPESDDKPGFDLTRAVPILPNLFDRSRPVFDTQGRALEALRKIWLNAPTGPLADDALMLSASYHHRKGDYMEADRLYRLVREEYPKSPHLEDAFVLGSHVRLMSYQGPEYDGKALEEARQINESTLRLFPDTKERERLLDALHNIEEAQAARDWETVEYYRKRRKPRAMAVYCRQILENYPQTSYADLARQRLAELREAPQNEGIASRLMSAVAGAGRNSDDLEETPAETDQPQPAEDEQQGGFGRNLLRRVPAVPRLFRIPGTGGPADNSDPPS